MRQAWHWFDSRQSPREHSRTRRQVFFLTGHKHWAVSQLDMYLHRLCRSKWTCTTHKKWNIQQQGGKKENPTMKHKIHIVVSPRDAFYTKPSIEAWENFPRAREAGENGRRRKRRHEQRRKPAASVGEYSNFTRLSKTGAFGSAESAFHLLKRFVHERCHLRLLRWPWKVWKGEKKITVTVIFNVHWTKKKNCSVWRTDIHTWAMETKA